MASTTLASIAAATAAGYIRTQIDYGDQGPSDNKPAGQAVPRKKRYVTRLHKDGLGTKLSRIRAMGESDTSAAAADTAALAVLNAQRQARYGFDTTALNINPDTGSAFAAADI